MSRADAQNARSRPPGIVALGVVVAVEAAAVLVPSVARDGPWLTASSFVVGGFVTGTVPLVLGRIHELLPHDPARQRAAWSKSTVAFALCQALAGYGFSFAFARSGGAYPPLFVAGAVAMALALAIDLGVAGRRGAARNPAPESGSAAP